MALCKHDVVIGECCWDCADEANAENGHKAPRDTVPPRWRFENVRRALRFVADGRIRIVAEDDLRALEETFLPPVPTIAEFHAKIRRGRHA